MARKMKDEQEFEDLSSYSSTKEYKKRRKNKRSRTAFRVVAAVIFVLFILGGAGCVYISTELIGELTTTSITKDPVKLGIDTQNENIIMDSSIKNIALFGLDARNDSFEGASDAIMILTVDNKHKKLKMTSILRDSRVPIEGEMLTGEYVNWDTKINAAYSLGGPELAIRTLNRNFGLDIQDYVTINFANMAAIVDAFNGVEMEVTGEEVREINYNLWTLSQEVQDKIYEDQLSGTYSEHKYSMIAHDDFFKDINGEVNIQNGVYEGGKFLLNGNQAVAYGRIRYVGNDNERAHRQQKVLRALVGRLKDLSFSDYPGIIKQLAPLCATSLGIEDIIGLTPILTGDITMESINVPDVEYETDLFDGEVDNVWYYIYDVTEAAKRISSFIYEDASPYWEEFGNTSTEPGASSPSEP